MNKKQRAIELLDSVGLDESEAMRRVLYLSGGQQQRVAVAEPSPTIPRSYSQTTFKTAIPITKAEEPQQLRWLKLLKFILRLIYHDAFYKISSFLNAYETPSSLQDFVWKRECSTSLG